MTDSILTITFTSTDHRKLDDAVAQLFAALDERPGEFKDVSVTVRSNEIHNSKNWQVRQVRLVGATDKAISRIRHLDRISADVDVTVRVGD